MRSMIFTDMFVYIVVVVKSLKQKGAQRSDSEAILSRL